MLILQLADVIHTGGNLFLRVLHLAIYNPWFAIYGLQIIYQEDRSVVLAKGQRIVIFIVSLERRACRQQRSLIGRKRYTNLIKGGLVPVEQSACQCNRNRHQLAVCLTLVQTLLWELCQIKNIRVILQVGKVCTVAAVRLNPVPVNLHHVRRVAA